MKFGLNSTRNILKYLFLSICFGVIYFYVAKFALNIAIVPGQASAFYIPAGIAVSIVTVFGIQYIPVVILAKLAVGIYLDYGMGRLLFSVLASTTEAYIAYYLYHSFKNSIEEYFEYQSKMAIILVMGLLAPVFSALIGVTNLYYLKIVNEQGYFASFLTWYAGDFLGILIFLPAFLDIKKRSFHIFDYISPILALFLTYLFKFHELGPFLPALFFAILVPLSFGSASGVYYSMITIAMGLNWLLVNHMGPFSLGNYNDNLLSMQYFLFGLSLTALALEGFKKTNLLRNALIPLILFWSITGGLYYYFHTQKALTNEAVISKVIEDFEGRLTEKMQFYEHSIKGIAGFVSGSEDVIRSEWYEYIRSISVVDNERGVLGAGIIYARVTSKSGEVYVYPENLNQNKSFENIIYSPQLASVFQPYLYGQSPVLSPAIKIKLMGNAEKLISFLVMPVQKDHKFLAWIIIPIDMNSFFKSVIDVRFQSIDVDIYDNSGNEEIYSRVIDQRLRAAPRSNNRTSILVLANHTFTIDWNETLRYVTEHSSQNTLIILLGSVFSLLFTAFFLNLKLVSVKANKIANSKTFELRESEEKFKSLFENSSDAVILFNNDEIIDCNPESLELFGKHTKKDLLRTPLLDFFSIKDISPQGNLELFESKVREVRYKKMVKFECIFQRPRVPFFAEMHLHYIVVNDKFIFQAVVRDISERKKIEQNLTKSKELAEDAARAKSNFLSTMSHEIRTPLNGVIGMINIILDENPKSEIREDLETIKYSADNLLHIVNEVLDYNKIESGKIVLEKKAFSLQNLCENILKIHRPKALEKDLNLTLEFDGNVPEYVIGDEYRNNQILNNLLSNSLKFTEHGAVSLKVKLKTMKESSCVVEFKVSDTGIGIDKDKQKDIFKDFTQAESDHTRKYGGTGLGLAITKRLVEIQNGRIEVASNSKGTTFTFTIVFNLKVDRTMDTNTQTSAQNVQSKFEGQKVLLVEDNQVNIIVTKKFLEKWGLKVDIAINGLEAITQTKANTYDLILMDLHMPLMDGFEATKKIREFNTTTPIIGLSADVMTESVASLQSIGMSDFVTKPFRPNDFFLKLKSFI